MSAQGGDDLAHAASQQLILGEELDNTVESIARLMVFDTIHRPGVLAVLEAIAEDARQHDGQVDPNRVRLHLPVWVFPKIVGATYRVLIAKRFLVGVAWTTSTDSKGRNAGKPIRTYELVAPADIKVVTE